MTPELREALVCAIRAAKLALFVVEKHGAMPNDSWRAGFDKDIAVAEAALARPSTADRGGEVEVKALEWKQEPNGQFLAPTQSAQSILGIYTANVKGSAYFNYRLIEAARNSSSNLDSAKAIAQLDYTARIRSALATTAGDGWLDIESAPKDGSRLWLVNSLMEHPVIGQWGDYRSPVGHVSKQWIVTHDPHERYFQMGYGTLVCPTRWQPLPAALVTDKG